MITPPYSTSRTDPGVWIVIDPAAEQSELNAVAPEISMR